MKICPNCGLEFDDDSEAIICDDCHLDQNDTDDWIDQEDEAEEDET